MKIEYKNWADLAYKKSEITSHPYIFIAGSRELTIDRIKDIIKTYLPKGNLIIGILEDAFIPEFNEQPQFRTASLSKWRLVVDELETKKIDREIIVLAYSHRDTKYVLEKLKPDFAVFVNASWFKMFHLTEIFYTLHKHRIKYELISPFISEQQAIDYEKSIKKEIEGKYPLKNLIGRKIADRSDYKPIIEKIAKHSFDHTFQIGAALVKDKKVIAYSWNKIIPYETYSIHMGSQRELNFSSSQDLNNYDTIHAEIDILLQSSKNKFDLNNSVLCLNLLPCPTCAKAIAESGIKKIIYTLDHSNNYAINLFEKYNIECEQSK